MRRLHFLLANLNHSRAFHLTRYGDVRVPIRAVIGDELGDKLKPIWGLNKEGEINGTWRDSGVPNLYCMMGEYSSTACHNHDIASQLLWVPGNLALCRFYSKHLALREYLSAPLECDVPHPSIEIKAMEEGIFGERYSL